MNIKKEKSSLITNESIPHWASYITSDAEGDVYAWEYTPYIGSHGEYEYYDIETSGMVEYIGKTLIEKEVGCRSYEPTRIELW